MKTKHFNIDGAEIIKVFLEKEKKEKSKKETNYIYRAADKNGDVTIVTGKNLNLSKDFKAYE